MKKTIGVVLRSQNRHSVPLRRLALLGLAAFFLHVSGCTGIKTCPSAGPTECPDFVFPNVPHPLHQTTCSVTRSECMGWKFDPTSSIDEINCFGSNIVQANFVATACFDPARRTAQQACNDYCNDASLNPFANLLGVGAINCLAPPVSGTDVTVPDGQCGTSSSASNGKTTAVSCTLGGRQCNDPMITPDGSEQFCGSMPDHTFSISPTSNSLKGCFDPTQMSAQTFCQNMHVWPDNPISGNISPVEFPFVNVASITSNSPACTSVSRALLLAFAGGSRVGSVQVRGASVPLTAKGGFLTSSRQCDPETELCTTSVDDLKLVLNNITLAGLTISNPEVDLTSAVSLAIINGHQTIQPNSMNLQVEGDVAGFRRGIVNVLVPTPLTVTSTPASMSIAGSFATTINATNSSVVPLNITMAITGTQSADLGCSRHTSLQSLFGFESLEGWRSAVPLALTAANHTEGCFGLKVGGKGTRKIFSSPFTTPLPGVTSELALDARVPPGSRFVGSLHMNVSCPSADSSKRHFDEGDIEGNIVGQFGKVTFHVSSGIIALLNGVHPDCSFTLEVNQTNGETPIVFDNLRFQVGDAD